MEETDVIAEVVQHNELEKVIAEICNRGYKLSGISPHLISGGYTRSYTCVFTKRTERLNI